MSEPSIINVHTPTSSFAIVYSITEDTLVHLFNTLSKKLSTDTHSIRVGLGWVKYLWSDTYWNLDDESDYIICAWRLKATSDPIVMHVHDPKAPLPSGDEYRNKAFYLFHSIILNSAHNGTRSVTSGKSKMSVKSKKGAGGEQLAHKIAFEKFHSENGVRTVTGSIGPVPNVRMLLKSGYRHVYISRKFAKEHKFIPSDASPGWYGYGGLINIGIWPITLTPTQPHGQHPSSSNAKGRPIPMPVYLSEEAHFDVVLGRSFFEKRQIKMDPLDLTNVICLDSGEQLECELVVLKDGHGEIVTVT